MKGCTHCWCSERRIHGHPAGERSVTIISVLALNTAVKWVPLIPWHHKYSEIFPFFKALTGRKQGPSQTIYLQVSGCSVWAGWLWWDAQKDGQVADLCTHSGKDALLKYDCPRGQLPSRGRISPPQQAQQSAHSMGKNGECCKQYRNSGDRSVCQSLPMQSS